MPFDPALWLLPPVDPPPVDPPPVATPSARAASRFSPVDNPEEWPYPAPSNGLQKKPGLGPFLPFQPPPEDLLPDPFIVPNPARQRDYGQACITHH